MAGMMRILVLAVSVVPVAVSCSSSGATEDDVSCPAGTTSWVSTNELAGDGSDTREQAIRVELQSLDFEASDQAIAAAVAASSPGGNVGVEVTDVETEDGVTITMTLDPLDPGWWVQSSMWCRAGAY